MSKITHELKSRILFLLFALAIYRLGAHISVPGINAVALANQSGDQAMGGLSAMINVFSGGAFERVSIFMLGVMPYITASIIIQILSVIYPPLEQLKKEGNRGRRKITQYTRYLTLILAIVQGIAYATAIQGGAFGTLISDTLLIKGPYFTLLAVVSWMTGTMFLMWLGEQISERGVGNGISMIIFASIISGIPGGISYLIQQTRSGQLNPLASLMIVAIILATVWFVIYIERAQRKISISYARGGGRQEAVNKQTAHLPLKLNMAGVIPAIFGSALLAFLLTIFKSLSSINPDGSSIKAFIQNIGQIGFRNFSQGEPVQIILFAFMIIFFCFFYTALQFNSKETAENLKRSGAFVPGIRPGIHTSQYLDKILTRVTLWGSLYITVICLLPELLSKLFNLNFFFGGTSVLIAVVVVLDLVTQIQTHLMSHQYDHLMKKNSINLALSQKTPQI